MDPFQHTMLASRELVRLYQLWIFSLKLHHFKYIGSHLKYIEFVHLPGFAYGRLTMRLVNRWLIAKMRLLRICKLILNAFGRINYKSHEEPSQCKQILLNKFEVRSFDDINGKVTYMLFSIDIISIRVFVLHAIAGK